VATPLPLALWLYSWLPSRIVAFTNVVNGTLTVSTLSTGGVGGGSCVPDATPDVYGVLGFSSCAPALTASASGTFQRLSPAITALSALSPCVTTSPCTLPTFSAATTVRIDVQNLNPGEGVRIHVGDPASSRAAFCTPASPTCVADPANGYFGLADISLSAAAYTAAGVATVSGTPANVGSLIAQQLAGGALTAVLLFTPPAAQGSVVPIVLERLSGLTGDLSNNEFTVAYAAPVLATVDVTGVDGATALAGQTGLDATAFATVLRVPTRGGAFVKVRGANLGVLPTFAVGRDPSTPPLTPAPAPGDDCSSPPGAYNCWRVAIPAGQGSGAQFASEFGAETGSFSPSMQGLRGFYQGAAWGAWAGGFFCVAVWRGAGHRWRGLFRWKPRASPASRVQSP